MREEQRIEKIVTDFAGVVVARNARNQPDATYATVRRPRTIARPANRTNFHVLDARNARASFYLIRALVPRPA